MKIIRHKLMTDAPDREVWKVLDIPPGVSP